MGSWQSSEPPNQPWEIQRGLQMTMVYGAQGSFLPSQNSTEMSEGKTAAQP